VQHDIEVPPSHAASYRSPGQYTSIAAGTSATYFALAGDPLHSPWSILVRAGGEVVDALLALPLGADIALSPALGEGFPMAGAAGRRLFVVATGSGLAAVRPVVGARLRAGLESSTELFLGVRSGADQPLAAEVTAWRLAGLAVTVCCSRETGGLAGCRPGYVQDALRARAERSAGDVRGALVFAAGADAMIRQLRDVARDLELGETDVRTNY